MYKTFLSKLYRVCFCFFNQLVTKFVVLPEKRPPEEQRHFFQGIAKFINELASAYVIFAPNIMSFTGDILVSLASECFQIKVLYP